MKLMHQRPKDLRNDEGVNKVPSLKNGKTDLIRRVLRAGVLVAVSTMSGHALPQNNNVEIDTKDQAGVSLGASHLDRKKIKENLDHITTSLSVKLKNQLNAAGYSRVSVDFKEDSSDDRKIFTINLIHNESTEVNSKDKSFTVNVDRDNYTNKDGMERLCMGAIVNFLAETKKPTERTAVERALDNRMPEDFVFLRNEIIIRTMLVAFSVDINKEFAEILQKKKIKNISISSTPANGASSNRMYSITFNSEVDGEKLDVIAIEIPKDKVLDKSFVKEELVKVIRGVLMK